MVALAPGAWLRPSFGETLAIDDQVALKPAGVETPQRGSTMTAVEATLRRARQQDPARWAAPPITKWFYPNFAVVFEHDKVLHAVVDGG